jgi:HemY protein
VVAAGVYFVPDAGMASIEFAGWRVETSVVALLVAVALLYLLLRLVTRLLGALLDLPARLTRRTADQKRQAADEKLLRAWAERQRRESDSAARFALAGVEDGSLPPLHFQVAIDAWLDRLDPSRRGELQAPVAEVRERVTELLETVSRRFPRFSEFLRLHLTQRLMAIGEIEWAGETLAPLAEAHPRDEAILLLRAQWLERAGDHEALADLLPTLRRIKDRRLTADELLRIERLVLRGRIRAAARDRDLDRLSRLWAETNRAVVDQATVVIAYAEALLRAGSPDAAAAVLEKRLSRHREVDVLHAWAELPHADPEEARKRLLRLLPEDWSEPANAPDVGEARERAAFAYAMARLALESSDPTAARSWASRLPLDQEGRYMVIAARVHARLRDSSEAAILYERALARAGLEAAGPAPETASTAVEPKAGGP